MNQTAALSPAQKAWATRRLNSAMQAQVEVTWFAGECHVLKFASADLAIEMMQIAAARLAECIDDPDAAILQFVASEDGSSILSDKEALQLCISDTALGDIDPALIPFIPNADCMDDLLLALNIA